LTWEGIGLGRSQTTVSLIGDGMLVSTNTFGRPAAFHIAFLTLLTAMAIEDSSEILRHEEAFANPKGPYLPSCPWA